MLNAYGHSNVALLNGGWVAWTAEKRPTTTLAPRLPPSATFTATLQREWLAAADDVVAAIGKPGKKIVDARTVAEMDGTDTRLSSRGGVIPSAVPVYWEDLLDPSAKTFKPADELLYSRFAWSATNGCATIWGRGRSGAAGWSCRRLRSVPSHGHPDS
jgi:thiosulfate/3-mercaptopyruvate sulfurtransferase